MVRLLLYSEKRGPRHRLGPRPFAASVRYGEKCYCKSVSASNAHPDVKVPAVFLDGRRVATWGHGVEAWRCPTGKPSTIHYYDAIAIDDLPYTLEGREYVDDAFDETEAQCIFCGRFLPGSYSRGGPGRIVGCDLGRSRPAYFLCCGTGECNLERVAAGLWKCKYCKVDSVGTSCHCCGRLRP